MIQTYKYFYIERRNNMQLLEQLAMGGCTNVTLESITTEYASIQGYMECMSELCESEVLLEGIDIKGIFTKIGEGIVTLFGKIRTLGSKVIGFLRKKITEFTSKFKRKDKGEKKEEPKPQQQEPESQEKKEEPETTKEEEPKATEKTREEKIADILNQNPFTGCHPNGISRGIQNVWTFARETVGVNIPQSMTYDLKYFKAVWNHKKEMTPEDREELDSEFSDPSKRFKVLFNNGEDARSTLKGVLNSPSDIPKAIGVLYNEGMKGFSYEKRVLDPGDISFFKERLVAAADNIARASQDLMSTVSKNVDYCNAKAKEVESDMKMFLSVPKVDNDTMYSLKKYVAQIMNDFTMLANVNTMLLSAIPNVLAVAESDMSKTQAYVNSISAKINSI